MAKVIYGTIVTQISGSVGGNTFAQGANGYYIKRKPMLVNRRNIAQLNRRNQFQSIVSSWRSLSSEEQVGWILAAPGFPYSDSLGVTKVYTGFQLFSKFSNQLVALQHSITTIPPVVSVIPSLVVTSFDLVDGGPVLELGINFPTEGSTVVPDGFILVVNCTTSLSAGVLSPKQSSFKFIGFFNSGIDMTSYDISSFYLAVLGILPVVGTNVYVEVFLVASGTGQRGSSIRSVCTFE
jgi:hypothetical protein